MIRKMIFLLAIFQFVIAGCDRSNQVNLTFDGTEICVPENYVPESNYLDNWLETNAKGMDSSEGSKIIRLPPELIKEHVPEYILSHINKHDVDLKHEISGIADRLSNIGSPKGLAIAAWNVYQTQDNPLVIQEESGRYRIYHWGEGSSSWYLAKEVPPKDSGKEMPSDWFVGYCNNNLDTCSQSVTYKDIFYSYDIHLLDIGLSKEVANIIQRLFSDWEKACVTNN